MWQGINRRRFPRADYPCRVIIYKKEYQEEFDTHTKNIGTGGICVILNKDLKGSSEVELVLHLKDGQPPVKCHGRIVWAVEKGESRFDTGIAFSDLKDIYRLRIAKIVDEWLRRDKSQ